jgi:VWFA-related protein
MKNITLGEGNPSRPPLAKETVKVRYLKLLALSALLLSALPASGQGGAGVRVAQPNAARFPEVTLYAYPTDARGVMPNGLAAGSFRVTEDGAPASISRVDAEGGSLDVCLALDRSPSMLDDDKLHFAKLAAHAFVDQLGGQDRAALITFASGNSLDQPLTADRSALHAAIERTQASGTSTTFFDAVYWAITQVAVQQASTSVIGSGPARPDARRVVLALTDGMDRGSRVLPRELLELARQNGISLCMISLGRDSERLQMLHLAQQTGGVHLVAPRPGDLQQLYSTLAQQLRREYRVTFRSPRPDADATRRNVKLSVTPLGAQVEAWYQAPSPGNLLAAVPTAGPTGSAVTGSGRAAGTPPLLVLGAVLMALGLVGAAVAMFIWQANRREQRLPVMDSNPRLDLLPLWVREGSTRIGRGPECELVLDSREVSRVHARIEAWDGIFRIVDENSSNGTFVNERRVRRKELRVGDVIRFGDREFRFAGEMRT